MENTPINNTNNKLNNLDECNSIGTCVVCQDDIKSDEEIKVLDCKHEFHKNCINPWIKIRNLCPLCRTVADNTKPVKNLNTDDTISIDLIRSSFLNNLPNRAIGFFSSNFNYLMSILL